MFAGMDSKRLYGMIDYDPCLIERFEKPKELHRIWNLAVMSALQAGQLPWEDLASFKKPYTEGKEFKAFKAANLGHDHDLRAEIAKEKIKQKEEK
jgi:hypothetical protein